MSTKFFWGINGDVPNMRNTLNRKYLMQAVEGSLDRLRVDFIDLIFCHRADPETPIEETVWAMHDIVSSGKALYWGTSEVDGRRDPCRVGDRRTPSLAQARHGATAVQPARARSGRDRVRPRCTTTSVSA